VVSSANCAPVVGEKAMAWRELQRWGNNFEQDGAFRLEKHCIVIPFPFAPALMRDGD
jgi:hypothetical protein